MSNLIQGTLTAENTFTDVYLLGANVTPIIVITEGTWAGTLTLQIQYPGRTTFIDVPNATFTSNFDTQAYGLPNNTQLRVGFKTGEYTSGTASIDITQ